MQTVSNDIILAKAIGGQKVPFLGVNNLYNILYKTEFLVDGRIYIGVHCSSQIIDSYIGCGVDSVYSSELAMNYSKGSFVGLVKRYGVSQFRRENLLYFNSVDEALLCEKSIVDLTWIKDRRSLNLRVGGLRPPRLLGEKNGNYRNFWSSSQKKSLSEKRRLNGKSKGSLNGNAKPIVLINIYTDDISHFSSAIEAYQTIKPNSNYYTLLTFISRKKLYDRQWICIWLEDYLQITDISVFIDSFIESSRFKKNILTKRNDCKKH